MLGDVRLGSFCSTARTCAMVGSAAAMGMQPSLMTILPFFGVVVQSTLFGMWSGAVP